MTKLTFEETTLVVASIIKDLERYDHASQMTIAVCTLCALLDKHFDNSPKAADLAKKQIDLFREAI